MGILMGSDPYTTPLKLWELKNDYREDAVMNRAMEHGVRSEPLARQWVNEQFALRLIPICVEEEGTPYFRASLDGFDMDSRTLCEIKCPVSDATLDMAIFQKAVPAHWMDQIQWQIMLTDPARAFFAIWDYREERAFTVEVIGDSKRIEKMRKKGKEFWEGVRAGKPPPPEKGDYIEIKDENLHEKLLEYQNLSESIKTLNERKNGLKREIEGFSNGTNCIAYGFKLQHVSSSPSYDINKMRLEGIEVDEYRKKGPVKTWCRIIPPGKG